MKERNYKKIYEKYSENIMRDIDDIIFVSKKWNDADLIWSFSDLDLRIILENNNYNFFKINEEIYKTHKKIVSLAKNNQRILEHPPGYIFFEQELINNRVEDVNNWSFCYGNKSTFNNLKNLYSNRTDCKNINYYKKIIAKRYKNFSFKNEFNQYKGEELWKYRIYCAIWHYYLPCLYAIYSISDIEVKKKKCAEELIKNQYLKEIYHNIKNNSISRIDVDQLLKIIDTEISNELKQNNIDLTIGETSEKDNILEAISMLRTRICRYKLYLDSTLEFDRNYLINRELNELKFIINEIHKNMKIKETKLLLEHINLDSINTKDKLEYTLKYLYDNQEVFNNIMNKKF